MILQSYLCAIFIRSLTGCIIPVTFDTAQNEAIFLLFVHFLREFSNATTSMYNKSAVSGITVGLYGSHGSKFEWCSISDINTAVSLVVIFKQCTSCEIAPLAPVP